MSYLSELKATEQPTQEPKVLKSAPVVFVGHIPADELEARVDELIAAIPGGWAMDEENVRNSLNPATGTYQRYLMVRNDAIGSNLTVYSTGTVNIVRPNDFEGAFGDLVEFGIVEGKAPKAKWAN